MLQHLKCFSFIPCEREKLQLEHRHYHAVLNLPGCDCVKFIDYQNLRLVKIATPYFKNAFLYRSLSHCSALPLTYDQVFFFSGERESVAARESAVGRRKKKTTPDTITTRVVCHPLFANPTLSCVMLLM